jgi:hypothetical protein
MRVNRRHAVRLLTVLAVGFGPAVAFSRRAVAQSSAYNMDNHRAVYLLNFARYTKWPDGTFANEKEPIRIYILGKDPFGKNIDIIRSKDVNGRKLEIPCIDSVEEAKNCQILFIVSKDKKTFQRILKTVENKSILTVAESEGFLDANGMINLFVENDRLKFDINLAAAQKANLKLDSDLLKLAKTVKT